MIKFKGETLYEGPVAAIHYAPNWNNSMYDYYPSLWISTVVDGKIEETSVRLEGWNESYQPKELEITVDEHLLSEYNRICKEAADIVEFETIRLRKTVRVVKGRKYPIGTEGRVFWIGDTMYGKNVGVECLNGTKFFISISNIKVIAQEAT